MKNWQDWVWYPLFSLLIVFFGGAILSGVVTFIAVASPPVANLAFCPLGRVAKINPNPFKSKSEQFGIICYDQKGSAVVAFPYTDLWDLERNYFHTPCIIFVSVLVVGYFVKRYMKQKLRSKRIYVA